MVVTFENPSVPDIPLKLTTKLQANERQLSVVSPPVYGFPIGGVSRVFKCVVRFFSSEDVLLSEHVQYFKVMPADA